MNFGDRVKQRRLELELTQEELAKRCGYGTKATISKIEKNDMIPYTKFADIAKALDCNPAYLMGWEDECGNKRKLSNGNKIALKDVKLLTLYSQLNKKNQDIVVNLINSLLDSQK